MIRTKVLGWALIAFGVVGAALGAFIAIAYIGADSAQRHSGAGLLGMMGMIQVFIVAPCLLGGIGLLSGQRWGRVAAGVACLFLLLVIPVGTVVGVYGLWALLSTLAAEARSGRFELPTFSEAFVRDYFQKIGLIVIAMAILGAIIGLGYVFRDQVEKLPSPRKWGPLVVIVFAVLFSAGVVAYRSIFPSGLPTPRRMKARAQASREMQEHRAWVDSLRADPVMQRYVEGIARGEGWSPQRIAYDRDPEARACCEHLRGVEGAMRRAGIDVRFDQKNAVRADCHVPPQTAVTLVQPPAQFSDDVRYSERGEEGTPMAIFSCAACHSWITTVHANDKKPDTPEFPSSVGPGAAP